MEDINPPLDTGATDNIECQHGTCFFGSSSVPTGSDVNEDLPAPPFVVDVEVNTEPEEIQNVADDDTVRNGTSDSEISEDPQTDHEGETEDRLFHTAKWTKEQIITSELQQSYDKMCSICMEVVMEKRPREQRFGILPKCRHVFCLKCIRGWRKTDGIPGRARRSCPVCRTISHFVCPSFVWVEEYQAKAVLIKAYKKGCKQIRCKYVERNNVCPFRSKCFYRHTNT